MRRKQREFGALAGASVLPISRTSSGASRASGCPAETPLFTGGSPNPLNLETESDNYE